ncbi:hypothetical protein RLOatenuis_1950 [Rickettsiales bacterium]|nr:hypothetical protein RLOatenuis_1950 [Rickettsiales bacterium]
MDYSTMSYATVEKGKDDKYHIMSHYCLSEKYDYDFSLPPVDATTTDLGVVTEELCRKLPIEFNGPCYDRKMPPEDGMIYVTEDLPDDIRELILKGYGLDKETINRRRLEAKQFYIEELKDIIINIYDFSVQTSKIRLEFETFRLALSSVNDLTDNDISEILDDPCDSHIIDSMYDNWSRITKDAKAIGESIVMVLNLVEEHKKKKSHYMSDAAKKN